LPDRSRERITALHLRAQRRNVHAEHQRDSQHAFVANQTDFEAGMFVDRSDQGNEAISAEEDVANSVAGITEDTAITTKRTSRGSQIGYAS
jgi:hypothetical protein